MIESVEFDYGKSVISFTGHMVSVVDRDGAGVKIFPASCCALLFENAREGDRSNCGHGARVVLDSVASSDVVFDEDEAGLEYDGLKAAEVFTKMSVALTEAHLAIIHEAISSITRATKKRDMDA